MSYILLQDCFLVNFAEFLAISTEYVSKMTIWQLPHGLYDRYFMIVGIYCNISHSEPVILINFRIVYCFNEGDRQGTCWDHSCGGLFTSSKYKGHKSAYQGRFQGLLRS